MIDPARCELNALQSSPSAGELGRVATGLVADCPGWSPLLKEGLCASAAVGAVFGDPAGAGVGYTYFLIYVAALEVAVNPAKIGQTGAKKYYTLFHGTATKLARDAG